MTITELIFPALKANKASIGEVEPDWPTLSKGLTHPNPGLLNAFRGWVVAADEQDARDAHQELIPLGEFYTGLNSKGESP